MISTYELSKEIGSGLTSIVMHGKNTTTGNGVAVKVMNGTSLL